MNKITSLIFIILLGPTIVMAFDYKSQPKEFWHKNLSGETLQVCRYSGTERAGSGIYAKEYRQGTYYCACCGGDFALFQSDTKFDSGTGWPSFFAPIKGNIIERPDPKDKLRGFLGLSRTEVICARCHSHLGHVFNDGPQPTGLRYCMNSAALVFVPTGDEVKRTYEVEKSNKN